MHKFDKFKFLNSQDPSIQSWINHLNKISALINRVKRAPGFDAYPYERFQLIGLLSQLKDQILTQKIGKVA